MYTCRDKYHVLSYVCVYICILAGFLPVSGAACAFLRLCAYPALRLHVLRVLGQRSVPSKIPGHPNPEHCLRVHPDRCRSTAAVLPEAPDTSAWAKCACSMMYVAAALDLEGALWQMSCRDHGTGTTGRISTRWVWVGTGIGPVRQGRVEHYSFKYRVRGSRESYTQPGHGKCEQTD